MPEQQQQPQAKQEKELKPKQDTRYGINRRTKRNRSTLTAIKTRVDKVEKLMTGGDAEAIKKVVKEAVSALDKAAVKGVVHKNQAARRKSRLIKKVARAAVAPAAKPRRTRKTKAA